MPNVTVNLFVDDVIMRLTDLQLAFPFIWLAIAILAVLGPGLSKGILVFGLTGWAQYRRLTCAQVLRLRESPLHYLTESIK